MNNRIQDIQGFIRNILKASLQPGDIALDLTAGREYIGKKGVVKDPQVHQWVLEHVLEAAESCGLVVKGLDFSPIRGPEGNIEYLAWLQREEGTSLPWRERIPEIVQEAQGGRL